MIVLDQVSKRYADAAEPALTAVNLRVAPGEVVAVIGPSGAGKSTLLRAIVGLERITTGTIDCFGHTLSAAQSDDDTLRALRQRVGYCFQDFQLFPHLTVRDNVALSLRQTRSLTREEAAATAARALERVGCAALQARYPASLSGGQRQRVSLARALVLEPMALLFDEPVSALDPENVSDVVSEIRELRQLGKSLIVTTHHLPFARAIATQVVFMVRGEIIEQGTPEQVFDAPAAERLRSYLAHCVLA